MFRSVMAGVCFAIWPLFMNKSGVSGYMAAFLLAIILLVIVTPLTLANPEIVTGSQWVYVVTAGVIGAIGTLIYTGVLSRATPQNIGTLVVLQLIAQAAIPALFQIIQGGGMSKTKMAGFVCAGFATFLLTKG